jgi:hypothetical protein
MKRGFLFSDKWYNKTLYGYKVVRVHPESHELVDAYTGTVRYVVGEVTEDQTNHGLSVHRTAMRALSHPVPADSAGKDWPAILIKVRVEPDDIMSPGFDGRKTLVRRLKTIRVLGEYHADVVQRGLSAYRLKDALGWREAGWGGYRIVRCVRRGAMYPEDIPAALRGDYVIECRPSSRGRWGRCVDYRAVPRAS